MLASLQAAMSNPANVGLIVAALTATVSGAALYLLRELPHKLYVGLNFLFTVELTIYSEDEMYYILGEWLAKKDKTKNARTLMMNEQYDHEAGKWTSQITLGSGYHLIRHRKNWFLLHRHIQEKEGLSALFGRSRTGEIDVKTFGRSQRPIRELMAEIKADHESGDMTRVYYWNNGDYKLVDRKHKRPLDTIFMDEKLKAYLISDMETFQSSKEAYRKRGTPYRRGYCFWGQTGTGKTSLLAALAGHIGRSIYVINLSQAGGDSGLQAAINGIGPDGIGIIEDIDTHKVSHKREGLDGAPVSVPKRSKLAGKLENEENADILTLSGLLNAIDGIASREGRMLAITTNRLDTLDPALVRPGRFPVCVEIPPLGEYDARRMYAAYFPDDKDQTWFNQEVVSKLPLGASAIEEMYVNRERALADKER